MINWFKSFKEKDRDLKMIEVGKAYPIYNLTDGSTLQGPTILGYTDDGFTMSGLDRCRAIVLKFRKDGVYPLNNGGLLDCNHVVSIFFKTFEHKIKAK